MSKRNYRIYTAEFKYQALNMLETSEKNAGEIERELGITPGLLVKWKAKYRAVEKRGNDVVIDVELTDIEAARREIRRLQKTVKELEEEKEILKKAVSIFSRKER